MSSKNEPESDTRLESVLAILDQAIARLHSMLQMLRSGKAPAPSDPIHDEGPKPPDKPSETREDQGTQGTDLQD